MRVLVLHDLVNMKPGSSRGTRAPCLGDMPHPTPVSLAYNDDPYDVISSHFQAGH